MSYERSPRLVCSMTIGTYIWGSTMPASCPQKYTTSSKLEVQSSTLGASRLVELQTCNVELPVARNVNRTTPSPQRISLRSCCQQLPARRSNEHSLPYVQGGGNCEGEQQ